MNERGAPLALLLTLFAPGLARADADCVADPWECGIGVGYDRYIGQNVSFAHFCTVEFIVTSTRAVPDPFNTMSGGDRVTVVGADVAHIWPGRYEGNDDTNCRLPLSLGLTDFFAGGVGGDVNLVNLGAEVGSRWLGRVVTEHQVQDYLFRRIPENGCPCSKCPCPTVADVPRDGVLWLVVSLDFPFGTNEDLVRQAMDEGKCPIETPPCNCTCNATKLGLDNGSSLMALFAFSTVARRVAGWWARRRLVRAQDAA